jgi:pyridoxal phosphate-dependent aminotransferase EpsN
MQFRIYLSPPLMGGKEIEYIREAIDTNWVAPHGPSIDAFEDEMAQYIGVESALALNSGTAGIHLSLRWCGIKQGDLVFCSDFTFIGSCDAILYEKCTPVFIDSEPDSWNMSPIALEKAFRWAEALGKLPKAVIIVDLYGESADWDSLLPICQRYSVPVIEDAAEAVGTVYKGKSCGSYGDLSVLSFNGNKILTTSGGGMVLSNNKKAIEKMRFWSTQAREQCIHYEHKEYGYNYRMSNICASIGRGQLEFLPEKLSRRYAIHHAYKRTLEGLPCHIKESAVKNSCNYWLNLLVIDDQAVTPEEIVKRFQTAQIESRPTWKPMHMQPLFKECIFISAVDDASVDEDIFKHSVCLPSGDALTLDQIKEIADEIRACFQQNTNALEVKNLMTTPGEYISKGKMVVAK